MGCSSGKLCCTRFSQESAEATYCNNHRDAVGKYINVSRDPAERRDRLERIKKLYDRIKFCESVECIETEIYSDRTRELLPGFEARYAVDHEFAEQEAPVRGQDRARLILCGFRHAIQVVEEKLKREGY